MVLISYDQINLSVRRTIIFGHYDIVMTAEKRYGFLFSTSPKHLSVSRFSHGDKVAEHPLRKQGSPALLSLPGNLLYGARIIPIHRLELSFVWSKSLQQTCTASPTLPVSP